VINRYEAIAVVGVTILALATGHFAYGVGWFGAWLFVWWRRRRKALEERGTDVKG
jgi:hypothetical protein